MDTNIHNILYTILVVLFVCVLGLILVNQFIQYRYSAQLLGGPCQLCAELNPAFSECVATSKAPDATGSVFGNVTFKQDAIYRVSE